MRPALIVGLGKIGLGNRQKRQLLYMDMSHASAISKCDGLLLAGAVDPLEGPRTQFEEQYKQQAFSDIGQALAVVQPMLLVVASPTQTHEKVLQQALQASSVQVILCEKPFTGNLQSAKTIASLGRDKDIPIFINYQRRASPALQEVKKKVQSGELGNQFKGVAWYTKGLIHNGSHLIDLLVFLFGPLNKARVISATDSSGTSDAEADLVLSFSSGDVYMQCLYADSYEEVSLEVFGDKGYFKYSSNDERLLWGTRNPSRLCADEEIINKSAETLSNETDLLQFRVYSEIIQYLDGGTNSLCTAGEASDLLATLQGSLRGSQ